MRADPARRARWLLEAAILWPLFALFHLLGPDRASSLAGALARRIGPRLPLHRQARSRMLRALAGITPDEAERHLGDCWENFGRVAAEFAHLGQLWQEFDRRFEIEGGEHLAALAADGRPGIVVSAHFGNSELCDLAAARFGAPLAQIHRRANNPWIESLLRRARREKPGRHYPKGSAGARALLAELAAGGHIGLTADQRMNEGIPLPFLGRPAMTGLAIARLALRYRCPVVPLRIERLEGCRFRAIAEAPLALPDTGDPARDEELLMRAIGGRIEAWVRRRPGQWFWLHNRWGD
ncbi:MAG: lauroyl acyltransferase [Alphaproteobacteria bacterium]|nr:lauroyl acyltransferase [Alphaproteobacteria bacterium]